ncbi:MAG TPA: HNH endonuclease [Gemmataceae bacterium]|nr:HNH endonuclease [Gemmataceae bacterium]
MRHLPTRFYLILTIAMVPLMAKSAKSERSKPSSATRAPVTAPKRLSEADAKEFWEAGQGVIQINTVTYMMTVMEDLETGAACIFKSHWNGHKLGNPELLATPRQPMSDAWAAARLAIRIAEEDNDAWNRQTGEDESAAEKMLAVEEIQLVGDLIASVRREQLASTTQEALVLARIGQGPFRKQVLQLWGQCALTGSVTFEAIRASHIKPWRDSTDEERLDPYNGIPLVASLDALFDAGLISFETSGAMIVSPKLSDAERNIFGIVKKSLSKKPPARTTKYLAFHRTNCFKE